MKKHKKRLDDNDETFKQLAEKLGDLTYDSLALFLRELSLKLSNDGDADFNRGRHKLSKCLKDAAMSIENASELIVKAWRICEPYMDSYEKE